MLARLFSWFGFSRMTRADWFELGLVAAVSLLMLLVGSMAAADDHSAGAGNMVAHHEAARYQRDLTRNARLVWGLDAPVATFAAQIHQESRWNANARSPVGAQGMAQFMPATATWISGVYPGSLGTNQPTNPVWAMRALVTYDRWLWDRIRLHRPQWESQPVLPSGRGMGSAECERMAFTLSAYNGGLGHVYNRQRLSVEPGRCFASTCEINPGISAANQRENRDYPRLILTRFEPLYVKAGWSNGVCT